jgi:Rieske Fe-S protein
VELYVHFKSTVIAETGNVTVVAKGLLKKLKNFEFLHAICFHLGCFYSLKSLSLLFYKQDILISTVQLQCKIQEQHFLH